MSPYKEVNWFHEVTKVGVSGPFTRAPIKVATVAVGVEDTGAEEAISSRYTPGRLYVAIRFSPWV
jgi:hypothetical protein